MCVAGQKCTDSDQIFVKVRSCDLNCMEEKSSVQAKLSNLRYILKRIHNTINCEVHVLV